MSADCPHGERQGAICAVCGLVGPHDPIVQWDEMVSKKLFDEAVVRVKALEAAIRTWKKEEEAWNEDERDYQDHITRLVREREQLRKEMEEDDEAFAEQNSAYARTLLLNDELRERIDELEEELSNWKDG